VIVKDGPDRRAADVDGNHVRARGHVSYSGAGVG
jgi:hypothetical protein